MSNFLKNRFVLGGLLLIIIINLTLIVRLVVEGIKSEDICTQYVQELVQKSNKDAKYWVQEVPEQELSERGKRWGKITREFHEILKCEEEQGKKIKYFIFF